MDQDYYEGRDYLSPVPADGERTEEFEYEVGIAHHCLKEPDRFTGMADNSG